MEYTPEFIKETTGRYLFTPDEVIEVYFKNETLFLIWRGNEKIEPILLGANVFFVKELNKKMHFVTHPETRSHYLSVISEDEKTITYDYIKLADSVQVPSVYLKNKQYDEALKGYLNIQKEDSTSTFLNEHAFNRFGYQQLREAHYKDAIEIFKINVALHPTSDNVYDSLADAYARSGDSLQAYENYKKALDYNTGNTRAKRFVEAYDKK
ncbi:tetratricopeptide repeat protein [Lacinutrix neustonica]|uniref:Tetratricopeptide repeat protein n=1 Tax=Lacinutrix neustonica TaxID=2980107 RepID=A0A9E8MW01_9FLAO|nr:tetratricopeptide repeat protein [Lacinutrix neustonica]WAC01975.1 tetratricopeptide repeat protein [Lacinutrix neustonica]